MQNIKKLSYLLSSSDRFRMIILLTMIIFMALIDMAGVASIMPFIALISNPEIIVAAQPTRGLDVSAVESIHKLIINQRNLGSAVLLVSEDLDELFKLSDRIIVLFEGRLIKEFDIESTNIESLGLAMAGINE